MQVPDFSRSFIRWRFDLLEKPPITASHEQPLTENCVRIPIECRLTVEDRAPGAAAMFHLGAACRSERVNVERDVWTQPNANFHPVFSSDEALIIKSWDRVDKGVMLYPESLGPQPERQVEALDDAYVEHGCDVPLADGTQLPDLDAMIDCFESGRSAVSITTYRTERYAVRLEYPVKTVNFSRRDGFYQVDTGPVLLPDLDRSPEDLIGGLRLAYVAHNSPSWAELIVHVPTRVDDNVQVHHYSRSVRWEGTENMIVAVEGRQENT